MAGAVPDVVEVLAVAVKHVVAQIIFRPDSIVTVPQNHNGPE